jgi:Lrp/AsnC family transcriptional regulator for asnA, asnC and gidA
MSEVLNNSMIMRKIMVSKIDKKILELLQQDARIPITKIAKEVNMSENGVKYRLEKLEDKGIIRRFAVLIDPKKMGKNVMAIFNIEIEPKKLRSAIPKLKKLENFIKIYNTTGDYSITAIGLFDSNESLTNFINNKLLLEFSIQNYTFDIVTKQYKESIYLI